MLNDIMNMIKSQVAGAVAQSPEVPEDKKDHVVDTTANSVMDSLRQYVRPDNVSALTSLLGGAGSSESAATRGNSLADGMQSNLMSTLAAKTGISPDAARKIAAVAIPTIIAVMAKRMKDKKQPGFNMGSLVSAFTGKTTSAGTGADMTSILGGLFTKKNKG